MHLLTIAWKVGEAQDGITLDQFLRQDKQFSRTLLTKVRRNGAVYVNGRRVKTVTVLAKDDRIVVAFPPEKRSPWLVPVNMKLDVVYEDKHLLVLNKPPGLRTIPTSLDQKPALAHGVIAYYEAHGLPYTFHPVGRLDRDTSGLLLIAKHRYAHDLLSRKAQHIQRHYLAIVHGQLRKKHGTICLPIGRKENSIIERCVRPDGKKALTHYRVVQHMKESSLVRLTLETGRTHQIRVHMAALGHPLIGDDLYGGPLKNIKRQALHSAELSFSHPFFKKVMTFSAPLPKDMARFKLG